MQENLRPGEFGRFIAAQFHLQAFALQPGNDFRSFVIADLLHGGVERRLAEAFLEAAGGVQKLVGNDGIEHAHAAFIEHAKNGFVPAKSAGELTTGLLVIGRQFQQREIAHVGLIMRDGAGAQPLMQTRFEKAVREGFTPERGVAHPCFGEGGIEV